MSSTPKRWIYYPIYLSLSLVGLYYMRIGSVSQMTGLQLEPLLAGDSNFVYPNTDIVIKKHYTGLKPVDGFLSVLVTAFLAGPLALKKYIQVQQAYFLCSWLAVLVVWSVESVRLGNRYKAISFTSLWALLYQTVGGAVIIPLYFIFFTYSSSHNTFRHQSFTVPTSKSSTLLLAVAIGYVILTVAMYVPFGNINWSMIATAIWQPSPIMVNILWTFMSALISNGNEATKPKSTAHVKTALVVTGLVTAIGHLSALYLCTARIYPDVTFTSIFVPIQRTIMPFEDATHFIFQIDYAIIFIATTIWCFQSISDVERFINGGGFPESWKTLTTVLSAAVIVGPAATLSAVWYWRENKLSSFNGSRKMA